jgi:hypothetical protein
MNRLRKAGLRADLPPELLAERRRVIAEIARTPRRALGVLPSPTKLRPAGFGYFKICRKRAAVTEGIDVAPINTRSPITGKRRTSVV